MPAKKKSKPTPKPAPKKSPAKAASKASTKSKPAPKPARKPAPKPTARKPTPARTASAAPKAKSKPVPRPSASKPAKTKSAKSRSFNAALDAEMTAQARGQRIGRFLDAERLDASRLDALKHDAANPGSAGKSTRHVDDGPAREFAIEAAQLVRDDKCEDVVLLDVRGMSQITDYIVIGSGTSERQMRSILQHVEEIGAARGFQAFRTNTDDRASWVLVDFVDVVVHLFEPNTRAHYDLETLWPDAKRVRWERADQLERDRAGIHA